MTATVVLCGLVVLVGVLGIVIPVLPGLLLVLAGIWIWVLETQTPAAWWVGGLVTVLYAAGVVLQYAVPGRRMKRAGVATSTLLVGVAVAIVCAFLIPVVGLLLGFPLGIYLVQLARRDGHREAWAATKLALRAVGTNILIELATAMAMIAVWVGFLAFVL